MTALLSRNRHLISLLRSLPQLARGRRARGAGPLRVRFVYGQSGAAMRYRVLHQLEQAQLAGLHAEAVAADDLDQLYDLGGCDLLYLYRLALNSRTWPLLMAARLLGIPALFDSDDLVWDEQERAYNFLDAHYPPALVQDILRTTRRTRALLRRADALVFSTPYLAQLARESFRQPTFVNMNALAAKQVAAAEAAYQRRQPNGDTVVLGYFCGTPRVHDEDFASVAPALAVALALCPALRLRLYGEVALPPSLGAPFAGRIERRAAVTWDELPAHIAQIDINIAPLIDNPQRRAKSAVKYLEAALLRVPTVASDLDPYSSVVADGATGLLAGDEGAWADALLRLARDPALRGRLGAAAYADAIAKHTTAARAPGFATILHAVGAGRSE